jgi:hypothetical protein
MTVSRNQSCLQGGGGGAAVMRFLTNVFMPCGQMVGGATLTVDGKPLGCTFCFGPTRQCKADKLVVTQPLLADADLDNARALRGRVALCRRGAAPLMSKEQRAAAAGARALICVNVADTLTVSVNIPAMGSIPMVMVRPSDEARLLASSSVVLHTTGPVASAAAVVKLLQGPQPVDAKLSTACITRLRGLMLTSKGRFSPDGTVEVMSVGGATAILSAMRSHVSAEDVQQGGCQALHSLMRKSPEGQAAVLSAGGVKAVVAAMRAHPSVEKVQFYAIGALFNLVRNSPGGQAAVLVAGGVAAVVAAMGTHQMAEMLQIGAMGALFHFSRARELGCMEALARGGAAAAVRASMEALPQDTRIQRLGVMLLAQLPDNEPPPPPHPPALPALQQGDS